MRIGSAEKNTHVQNEDDGKWHNKGQNDVEKSVDRGSGLNFENQMMRERALSIIASDSCYPLKTVLNTHIQLNDTDVRLSCGRDEKVQIEDEG